MDGFKKPINLKDWLEDNTETLPNFTLSRKK